MDPLTESQTVASSRHSEVDSLIMNARLVILILGLTLRTVFEGQVRGLEDRDLNGDYLFEQLLVW